MSRGKRNNIILSDIDLQNIKKLFEEGMGLNKISKILNINKSVIYRQGYQQLGLSGIERIPDKTIFTQKQLDKIKELFDIGYGARKIAKELNMTRDAIKRAMKQLNISNVGRKIPQQIIIPTERKCRNCEIIKSIDQFYSRMRNNRTEFSYICIKCSRRDRVKKNTQNRKSSPTIRLRDTIGYAIWRSLKLSNYSKNNKSCIKYLPYSFQDLKKYLEKLFEPWMHWNNWGVYNKNTWNDNDSSTWTWQIDHIIPHSTFRYTSVEDEEFKKCWALENLRPYSAKQNFLDGVNRTRH